MFANEKFTNEKMQFVVCLAVVLTTMVWGVVQEADAQVGRPETGAARTEVAKKVRVAAVQTKRRLVDWRISDPSQVLAAVDQNLAELEAIVHE